MSNQNWLTRIQNDPMLIDMVIPGSHDAGVYGTSLSTRKAPEAWARCQGSNIYNQAMCGSRMFDCRVFLKKDSATKSLVPTMGHFGREKKKHAGGVGSLGAYGGTLITAVNDAIAFVRTYPSEFLILRFSHTYCPGEVGIALGDLMQKQGTLNYIYTDQDNIALCPLSQLRGKVIMVFASEFHTNFSADDGYLPFYKYSNGINVPFGLCTCGIYKGSAKMTTVHKSAATAATDHKAHPRNHLHFVYWQQTMTAGAGDIHKSTVASNSRTLIGKKEKDYTGGAHANLGAYVDEIKANMNSGSWDLPNVISHDFVTDQTCKAIFELNPNYV